MWFYWTGLNGHLSKVGRRGAVWWRRWFALGAVVFLFAMVVGLCFMVLNLWWLVGPLPPGPTAAPIMMPVLPFVNVPLAEMLHYFWALILAGSLHELGHALAAASHNVSVDGVGAALVGVFPAAFVDLRVHELESAPTFTRLKVATAGVWHNMVLTAVVLLLLALLPVLLAPFFVPGVYIVRSSVPGLSPGVSITSLNGCAVHSLADWSSCWLQVSADSSQSFCVSDKDLVAQDAMGHECCEHDYQGGLQCFHEKSRLHCLSARATVQGPRCNLTSPCRSGFRCLDASLPLDDRLMWIEVDRTSPSTRGHGEAERTVLAGRPTWLWQALTLSERAPRMLGWLLGGLDLQVESSLRYIASLSAALALFNALPVFYLDGSSVVDTLWVHYIGGTTSSQWLEMIKIVTTFLVAANLFLSSKGLFWG